MGFSGRIPPDELELFPIWENGTESAPLLAENRHMDSRKTTNSLNRQWRPVASILFRKANSALTAPDTPMHALHNPARVNVPVNQEVLTLAISAMRLDLWQIGESQSFGRQSSFPTGSGFIIGSRRPCVFTLASGFFDL